MWQKSIYDQGTRQDINRERQHDELMAYMRQSDQLRHMDAHIERNLLAYDKNQTRRHLDYYVGVPNVENPPYADYIQLPPYEPGMPRQPMPQVHGSMWLT
ncbi:hypothetical protein Hanom_Chr14g01278071 [Helianthus anomalus]